MQGLNVGAPLKLQGVPIGSVSDISFVFNHYKTDYNYVLVRAEIYPDMVGPRLSRGGILDEEHRKKLVTGMIQKGLRLELSSQGITGVAFLNMVQLDPERYPKLPIDWKPEYLYIPSSPGTITLITEAIEDLTQKIGTIDIKAITDKIDQLLTTTNKAVEDAQIATVSQDIQKLLVSLESNSKSLHSILEGKEIRQSLKDLARTMENVNAASEELPRTISELSKSINEINRFTSAQRLHLDTIFENIQTSSENLRELTDTAKRYPSWVLFGNPPAHLNEVRE